MLMCLYSHQCFINCFHYLMVVVFIPVTCKIHSYNRLLESAYRRDHL